jgi:hypothetical protein
MSSAATDDLNYYFFVVSTGHEIIRHISLKLINILDFVYTMFITA